MLSAHPPHTKPHPLTLSHTPHSGDLPKAEQLLDKKDMIILKRCIYSAQVWNDTIASLILSLQRPHLPPIVTHNVEGDSTDPVLQHIRRVQLFNKKEDRVKVHTHTHYSVT